MSYNPTDEQLHQHDADTDAHVSAVRKYLRHFTEELHDRAGKHDRSKFEEPERSIFASVVGELGKLTYGSKEYQEELGKLRPAINHHYRENDHHPEHFENGIDDMNLFQVVEMFCDWVAACERHQDGDIFKSIDHNAVRFQMSEQLANIFRHTARAMGK